MNIIDKAVSTINTAKEIYNGLTTGVAALKDAETRQKFVELKNVLLDAQEQILGIKQEMLDQQAEIARLKEVFKFKDEFVLYEHNGHYYRVDANGKFYGAPYCSRCWEIDHKAVSVSRKEHCPECNAQLWRAVSLGAKDDT